MPLFRNLPIKRKLTLVILGTTSAALLLACSAFIIYDRITFRQSLTAKIIALADVIAVNSTAALSFNDSNDAGQTLHALSANASIITACLYRADGELFAEYTRDPARKTFPLRPEPNGVRFERDRLLLFRPVNLNGKPVGTIYIESGLEDMSERLQSYITISGVVLAGSFFLAYLISSFQRRLISDPILDLAGTAKEISEKQDYSLRVQKQSEDEIGTLTDSFNQMLSVIKERDSALTNSNDELREQIDARIEAERQLKVFNEDLERRVKDRTTDLQRSNSELEQFAYVASHDLQEPLRAVTGCVQVLQKTYRDKLDADAGELIHHVVEGAARMQTLIGDLLAFSRVSSHSKPFEATDCNVALDRALANLAAALRERDAVVTRDTLPTVTAEQVQLSQLFQNLIGNGLKFCGGRRPEIHVGAKRQEDAWLFSVRDNGIGIEPAYRERIFVIFQRLHTRTEYPGTGIGLAICKRIVERHNGQIWVESEPGKGSTFYFTIPGK